MAKLLPLGKNNALFFFYLKLSFSQYVRDFQTSFILAAFKLIYLTSLKLKGTSNICFCDIYIYTPCTRMCTRVHAQTHTHTHSNTFLFINFSLYPRLWQCCSSSTSCTSSGSSFPFSKSWKVLQTTKFK